MNNIPIEQRPFLSCSKRLKMGKYEIGDKLKDEDGNIGYVTISWSDGDICYLENDAAHPNPVIVGKWHREFK